MGILNLNNVLPLFLNEVENLTASVRAISSDQLAPLFNDPRLNKTRENPVRIDASGTFPIVYLADANYNVCFSDGLGKELHIIDSVPVRSSQNFGAAVEFQTVDELKADTLLSYESEVGQYKVLPGDIIMVSASGYSYEVTQENSPNAHLTTKGGVGLHVLPGNNGAIDICAFGVPNDLTTDISDIISAAMSTEYDLVFPRFFAVSRTMNFVGSRRNFHFPNTKIAIIPGEGFKSVRTFGSDANTGFDVVASLGQAESGCTFCSFTGSLSCRINTSGRTNLVFWAAERLSTHTYQPRFDMITQVSAQGFEYVFFGQGTTTPIPGSFTGGNIAHVDTYGCGAFRMEINQDDLRFGTIRDRGQSFLNADAVIDSYFLFGVEDVDETQSGVVEHNTKDGLVLGSFSSVVVSHLFVEGGFRHPVLLNGANNQFLVHSLRVSAFFSSQYGHVIECSADRCHIRLTEDPIARQGGHQHYIGRHGNESDTGLFEVTLTAARNNTDFREPIVYRQGATNSLDHITVTDMLQTYTGRYHGGNVSYQAFDASQETITDQYGISRYFIGRRSNKETDVTNHQRLALFNVGGNGIGLVSVTNINIDTYKGREIDDGMIVTLYAAGTGNVRLRSDAVGPIEFSDGAQEYTLQGNAKNHLTLMYNHVKGKWYEISRTEPLPVKCAVESDLNNISSEMNLVNKRKGKVVFDETSSRLVVAGGSTPNSPWYTADGMATIIPT